jgi:hypothetical protein
MESTFKKLSEVDIKSKIEKKGGQEYLSWSNAWGSAKAIHPLLNRTVYEDPSTGLNYFSDGHTAYVKVGVTIDGLEHIDYLPIMDYKNKSIKVDDITSMDVNKTIQRSTTKAIAMHGLGLNLWSGEDSLDTAKTTKSAPSTKIDLKIDDANWAGVVNYVTANKTKLDLNTIVKNLSVKYNLSTAVKKALGDLLK